MQQIHTRRGFTLIELLVVVLIIGILAAVAVPQYQLAVMKSRFVGAMTACDALFNAADRFQLANGSWPSSLDELDIDLPGTHASSGGYSSISTSQYSCAFFAAGSGSTASVLCSVKGTGLSARRFFNDPRRYCRALVGDAQANKVCRSVTNLSAPTSPDLSGYHYYRLP